MDQEEYEEYVSSDGIEDNVQNEAEVIEPIEEPPEPGNNLELKEDVMWYIIPVTTFPVMMSGSYIYQMIACIYFKCWIFFWIVSFFLLINIWGIVKDTKWAARTSLVNCFTAICVYLFIALWMIYGHDYSSTRISFRPAPNPTACFFLIFMNLLSIWSFLILSGWVNPTRLDKNAPSSMYSTRYSFSRTRIASQVQPVK